jgi:ubiquinone biosynthesis O-methyltransferase
MTAGAKAMQPKVTTEKEAEKLEKKHYDKTYSDNDYWRNPSLQYDLKRRINFSLKFIKPADSVIDVGCGGGGVSIGVANKASKVIGIDISKEGISHAKIESKGIKNIDFRCTTIQSFFNKNKEKYDVILFYECLEHLYGGDKIITILSHHLKKGGIFLLSTPNYDRLIYKVIRCPLGKLAYAMTKSERFRFHITHSHIKEYSVEEVKQLLKKNNLQVILHKGFIIWTDPILNKEGPTMLQKLNIKLGGMFPSIAGYMYIAARYEGENYE